MMRVPVFQLGARCRHGISPRPSLLRAMSTGSAQHWYEVPLDFTQQGLEGLHSALQVVGADWGVTIIASATIVRALTTPITIHFLEHRRRYRAAETAVARAMAYLRTLHISNPSFLAQASKDLREDAMLKARTSRLQQLPIHIPLNIGIFITTITTLRRMALNKYPGWDTGGFGWVKDLGSADPHYILPVANLVLLLTNTELSIRPAPVEAQEAVQKLIADKDAWRRVPLRTKMQFYLSSSQNVDNIKLGLQGLSVVVFPLVSTLPSGIVLFWCTSSVWSLFYSLRMRQTASAELPKGLEDCKAVKIVQYVESLQEDSKQIYNLIQKHFPNKIHRRYVPKIQEFVDKEHKAGRTKYPVRIGFWINAATKQPEYNITPLATSKDVQQLSMK